MRKSRKELKQMIKLYQSDNGALADEAIFYKERAKRAEAFIERLERVISESNQVKVVCIRGGSELNNWYHKLKDTIDEWRADPPKSYKDVPHA